MNKIWGRSAVIFGMVGFLIGCTETETGTGTETGGELRSQTETGGELRSQTGTGTEAGTEAGAETEVAKIVALPTLTDGNCEDFLTDWWEEHGKSNRLRLETDSGEVVIELSDAAPLHSANLHYKTSRNYYSPSEFVRVVPEFVVQGGNSEDPLAQERRWLIGKHTLPAEFTDELFHHRGAVAMGRTYEGNPEKRSASYDFYIVVGRKVAAQELFKLEQEKGFQYPEWAKERYLKEGGAPHLDREHTVFGRVVEGMEVVDKLSRVRTDASDWPVQRLEFRMEVAEN